MSNIQISLSEKNYADALVKLGQDDQISYNDIYTNLLNIQEILLSSNELAAVLENPVISIDIKNSIIDEVLKKEINTKIIDFFKIIIEKNRFKEFNGIVEAYSIELDKINNIKRVEIISAVELNDETKKQIINRLENKFQKKIVPKWLKNEDIIAGLVIKVDDNIIDSSLKCKLDNLSKNLSV